MKIRQLLLAVCVSVASAQFWDGPDDEKEKKRMEEIKDWSIQDAPPPNLDPSTMDDESCGDCKEGSKIFYYTGTVQKWTAPRCCIVIMSLWGAGGSNSIRAKHGGGGGFARGAVTGHGQDLYITVGEGAHGNSQNDRTDGPFFGGGGKMGLWCGHAGGGGGRTQVSMAPFQDTIDGVLLVAGGGGGAGTCPASSGGAGGCLEDSWKPQCSGQMCNAEYHVHGKGGHGGRAHNDFWLGHAGGDMGGGGGGGYYGGGGGEGMCDFGTGGGGGASFVNTNYVFSFDYEPGLGPVPGRSLLQYGLDIGVGGSSSLSKGGHGLVMLKWYPAHKDKGIMNKHPMLV